jgi:putative hemolysin
MAEAALPWSLPSAASDAPPVHALAPAYPARPEQIPPWHVRRAPYRARFARTRAELEAIQRLRYRVFNLELGEGLASSRATGRDADAFDESAHHLLVIDERDGIVVGTYRLATVELAALGRDFYSAQQFDLTALPAAVVSGAVELGRACVAAPHRGGAVLAMLWEGIAAYVAHNRKRWLFGCASLPGSAAREASRYTDALRASGHLHPDLAVRPRAGFEPSAPATPEPEGTRPVRLPSLVRRYLALGARICGEPAFDRDFGTLDYFLLLDFDAAAAGNGRALLRGAV